jgi:hypothetical protein
LLVVLVLVQATDLGGRLASGRSRSLSGGGCGLQNVVVSIERVHE